MMRAWERVSLLGVLLMVAAVALAGCGGSKKAEESPTKRLQAAKKAFDKSPALSIKLKGTGIPNGVSGLLEADGTATHQPAFEGTVKVIQSGLSASLDLVAVDDTVHVKFGTWQEIDPKQYNAPDPADLMDPETGLSSLLTQAKDPKAGKEKRDGRDTVTDVSATLPGKAVGSIIPSADASGTFKAVFTLNGKDQLVATKLTGPFYDKADKVTYTFDFGDYGSKSTVKAP